MAHDQDMVQTTAENGCVITPDQNGQEEELG